MRTLVRLTLIVLLLLAIYTGGFLYFVQSIPRTAPKSPRADGIVALTGGHARLDTAVELLESGAARRLLITGVFETTTKEDLEHRVHGGARFECCADIDYTAEDTHDNAEQAAAWASAHGYRSLIVVTARYHMPRSLREFSALMPGVRLVPYPVEPTRVSLDRWWENLDAVRLLQAEYLKYLATIVTTSFGTATPQQQAMAASGAVS